jgi:hypothetical protein
MVPIEEPQGLPKLSSVMFVKSSASTLTKAVFHGAADAVVLDMEVILE